MKKAFSEPLGEIVRFPSNMITESEDCCDDPYIQLEDECTNDGSHCGCPRNYGVGENCVEKPSEVIPGPETI